MKIIQIDGIRGLITALFIGVCLFAGFVIFPGYVSMHLWNKYLVNLCTFPVLNLFQGVLLWGIVAISYSIVSKKGLAVSFKTTPELTDAELDSIIKSAKINSQVRMMSRMISKADKVDIKKVEIKNNNISKSEEVQNSFVSSPLTSNKTENSENNEEEKVSNIK